MRVDNNSGNSSTGFCQVITLVTVGVGIGLALNAKSQSSPVVDSLGQALGNYIVESENDPLSNLLGSLANLFPTAALAIGSAVFGGMAVLGVIVAWFFYQILKKY